MAYLEGLLFGTKPTLPETRAGVPIYTGTAHGLAEWKFKLETMLAVVQKIPRGQENQLREQKLAELYSKMISGLEGDAFTVAQDVPQDVRHGDEAIPATITALEAAVSKFKNDDARELYKMGSKPSGPMSRQRTESMVSYIARRKRWYDRLVALNADTRISPNILADQLLEMSGLSRSEVLMVRTATNNESNLTTISECLRRQHPDIHELEKRSSDHPPAAKQAFRGFRNPPWKATKV